MSHIRINNYPISCLRQGPKVAAPFSSTEFAQDIIAKKMSLFTEIDMSNEHKAGIIGVLKIELAVKNFLNSPYIRSRLNEPKYIDYYNLILTNPYLRSSYFRLSYPFKDL